LSTIPSVFPSDAFAIFFPRFCGINPPGPNFPLCPHSMHHSPHPCTPFSPNPFRSPSTPLNPVFVALRRLLSFICLGCLPQFPLPSFLFLPPPPPPLPCHGTFGDTCFFFLWPSLISLGVPRQLSPVISRFPGELDQARPFTCPTFPPF